jgi:hypothetical protein
VIAYAYLHIANKSVGGFWVSGQHTTYSHMRPFSSEDRTPWARPEVIKVKVNEQVKPSRATFHLVAFYFTFDRSNAEIRLIWPIAV